MTTRIVAPDRRAFLAYFSSMGLGASLLPGVLWAKVAAGAEITKETIASAEEIAGVAFTDDERTLMLRNLTSQKQSIEALHKVALENSISPALVFDPLPPGMALAAKKRTVMVRAKVAMMARPTSIEELAFLPVARLSEMVRTRKVKPSELTEM